MPTMGTLRPSHPLNLERAVSASTRMGGHFVQGHVDTTATITSITKDGDCLTFRLVPRDPLCLRYVVEKGYVTLDGASLTVTAVAEGGGEQGEEREEEQKKAKAWFEVMLITYTQERVVMSGKREGEEVNVEVDMVGKYVEKSVRGYLEGMMEGGGGTGAGGGGGGGILEKMVGRMVDERMRKA
ncbi:MAG: Riboflavin synthase alpha chain [Ramalina farinacea]|uniref:Riboflavin synthase n=1 Tax=Ramalina farinacea TaxID=258253 RepID=A0AA43QTL4_9LECA|nr:Riboflavin synthase alpha chain [Ramalina farinacea]